MWAWQFWVVFASGRGKKGFDKSMQIYKTNKIMKKYPTIFQKCRHFSFWWFYGVKVGVALCCLANR